MSRGTGYGHGGPVGEIIDVLPLDATFHVTDCGYDDNDGRCGCYDLPEKLQRIIRAVQAQAWTEGFDRGFYDPLAGHGSTGRDASESAAVNPHEPSTSPGETDG